MFGLFLFDFNVFACSNSINGNVALHGRRCDNETKGGEFKLQFIWNDYRAN